MRRYFFRTFLSPTHMNMTGRSSRHSKNDIQGAVFEHERAPVFIENLLCRLLKIIFRIWRSTAGADHHRKH